MEQIQPFELELSKDIDNSKVKIGSAGKILFSRGSFNRPYILDPIQAAAIYELTSHKTLTARDMNDLRSLGFSLQEVEEQE